jgi:hypothetical protein
LSVTYPFGYDSIASDTIHDNADGAVVVAGPITTGPIGPTLGSGWAYLDSVAGSGTRSQKVRLIIFKSSGASGGAPIMGTTVVGVTDEITVDQSSAAGWYEFPSWTNFGGPPTLDPNSSYSIGVWWGTQVNSGRFRIPGDGNTNIHIGVYSQQYNLSATYSSTGNPTISGWTNGPELVRYSLYFESDQPLIFGNSDHHNSDFTEHYPGDLAIISGWQTTNQGGVLESGWFYVDHYDEVGTNQKMRLFIFDADPSTDDALTTLIGVTDEVAIDSTMNGTWVQFPNWTNFGGPPTLLANHTYWIGAWWGTKSGIGEIFARGQTYAPHYIKGAAGITYSPTANPVVGSWGDGSAYRKYSLYFDYPVTVEISNNVNDSYYFQLGEAFPGAEGKQYNQNADVFQAGETLGPLVFVRSAAATLVNDTDTGTDSETSVLTAAVTVTDTGTDTEAATETATYTVTDTGTGSETELVTVPVSATDTGTDTEASTLTAQITDTDTGTGADTSSLTTGGIPVSDTDTGTDTEAETLAAALTNVDTNTTTDTSTQSATYSQSDTGTSTEDGTITFSTVDTGTDTETFDLHAYITDSDSSTTDESGVKYVFQEESATASETAILTVQITYTDTTTSTEVATSSAVISTADVNVVSETTDLLAILSTLDSGTGIDQFANIAFTVEDFATDDEVAYTTNNPTVSDFAVGTDDFDLHAYYIELDTGIGVDTYRRRTTVTIEVLAVHAYKHWSYTVVVENYGIGVYKHVSATRTKRHYTYKVFKHVTDKERQMMVT